jgi:hypothetical protein
MGEFFYLLATVSLAINLYRPFGVSFPDLFYLFALIFFCIESILGTNKTKNKLPFHPFWIPAFFILIGGIISSFNAVNLNSSLSITIKEFYTFSIWLSMGILMVYRKRTGSVINCLILGGTFTSILTVIDYLYNFRFSQLFISSTFSSGEDLTGIRFGGTFGHPNSLGMFLGVVFPLALDKLLYEKITYKSYIYLLIMIAMLMSILMSGSVTGYTGIIIASVIIMYFRFIKTRQKLSKEQLLFILCSAIIFVGGYILLNQTSFFLSIKEQNTIYRAFQITGPGRFEIMSEGIKYIAKNPIWGAGMDQSGTGGLDFSELVTSIYIHNTILQSWVSGGILVFLSTLSIYIYLFLKSIQLLHKWNNIPYVIALSASTIGWICMDMAQPAIYQRFKWVIAALLLGIDLILNNKYLGKHLSQI